MADEKHGIGGAIANQVEDAPPTDEAEQVELDIFADLAVLGDPVNKLIPARGGPGRPKGAKNKRTQEWSDFILARHRSPLMGLAEIVSTPIPILAQQLSCKRIEAAEFWRKCSVELARYLHQAQPVAVQVDHPTAGMLTVINLAAPGPGQQAAASAFGLNMSVVQEIEEIQEVSGDENGQSHDDTVAQSGQAIDNIGKTDD